VSDDLDLSTLDRDGALRDAAAALPASTRRSFLATAGIGAGAALLGGLGVVAGASAQSNSDVSILNYALTLEYVQATFYTEAEHMGALKGVAARAAAQIGAVERAHVQALRNALGSKAVARPSFDFGNTVTDGDAFLRTAVAFEDLATAAYKGQLPNLQAQAYLAAALSIHSVEARHAAWIRYLAAQTPAANAVDLPISRPEAEKIVASTGFIVAAPATASQRSPRFTG
jgi:Ferritin-like domain